jgi:hypothetical protein
MAVWSALLTVEVAEVDGCSRWQRTFNMGAAIDRLQLKGIIWDS